MRIVSLCPSNTEMLAFLGLEHEIVGTDNYSDWPGFVKQLPKLGPDLDIDMAAVEKLKPDLVVASLTVPGMEKNVEALEQRNMPYIVLNPGSLTDIAENLLRLGEAAGRTETARTVYRDYKATLDSYRKLAHQVTHRTKLYWEWWAKPVFTPGGLNWLTEISELAGGSNVFADMPQASVKTDWEQVKDRNPDVICLAWVGIRMEMVKPDLVRQRPGWDKLSAVANDRVLVLEESLYCRPSPRLLTGMKKLAALLHPDIYPAWEEETPIC